MNQHPTDDLKMTAMDAVRMSMPGRKSNGVEIVKVVDSVIKINSVLTTQEIWDTVDDLVENKEVEDISLAGGRFLYRLTKLGESRLPSKMTSDREQKSRVECVHHQGQIPCPQCSKKNTGTSVIAATFPVIPFFCFDCRKTFKVAAKKIEGMSIDLKHFNKTGKVKPQTKGYEMSSAMKTWLKTQTVKQLVALYNKYNETKIKTFTSKAVGIKKVESILIAKKISPSQLGLKTETSVKKSKAAEKKTKKAGPSNMNKIREHFSSRKMATQAELSKLTGWDSANVHTAMSILKNKTRTKTENMVITEYDREKKTYTKIK